MALGHKEATSKLLSLGANVNHVAKNGASPLMIAASFGHVEIVEILMKEGDGLDLDYQHTYAMTTAMHFAAEMGRADIVRLLCEHGADARAKKKQAAHPFIQPQTQIRAQSSTYYFQMCVWCTPHRPYEQGYYSTILSLAKGVFIRNRRIVSTRC